MNLFRSSRKTEPESVPAPLPESLRRLQLSADEQELATATAEENAAAEQEHAASALCTQLDDEWRSWSARRDSAFREFSTAAERHAKAKAEVARLRKVAKFRSLAS